MINIRNASLYAALVALPTLSFAGTEAKSAGAVAPEKINSSAITGDIGVQVMSSSYSRGGILWKNSPTVLPYIDLFATAYEGDGFINKIVLGMNVTEYYARPDKGNGLGYVYTAGQNHLSWYENDFIPSIAITSGKFTLSEAYHIYEEPNTNAINTTQALMSTLSYDDGDALGALALHPSVSYFQHLKQHGSYFNLSVGPGFAMGPVAVSFPLTVAATTDMYYGVKKDGFAYFSAGLNLAYTLPMPKTYGTWTANTGVTYYAKEKKVVNCAETSDVVLQGGLMVAF